MEHLIVSDTVPRPAGSYSHGVIVNGLLFTAGMGPFSPDGKLVGATVSDQTTQVMRNLLGILTAAGRSLSDVVKVTVHLAELERDFADFNATYEKLMPAPYPVRTTVGSRLLGILVEIDVVALAE